LGIAQLTIEATLDASPALPGHAFWLLLDGYVAFRTWYARPPQAPDAIDPTTCLLAAAAGRRPGVCGCRPARERPTAARAAFAKSDALSTAGCGCAARGATARPGWG